MTIYTDTGTVTIVPSASATEVPAHSDAATTIIAPSISGTENEQSVDTSTVQLSLTVIGVEVYFSPTFDVYIIGIRESGQLLTAHSDLDPADAPGGATPTIAVPIYIAPITPTYDKVIITFSVGLTPGTFDETKFTVVSGSTPIGVISVFAPPSGEGNAKLELDLDRPIKYTDSLRVSYAP